MKSSTLNPGAYKRSREESQTEQTQHQSFTKMLVLAILTLPLLARCHPVSTDLLPLDCEDIFNNGSTHSGVYTIYPLGPRRPVQVFCDMGCAEDDHDHRGRWTVIQRRIDGSLNFYRPWEQYKNGFGDVSGEYWLGLQNIFLITWMQKHELRVEMEDFEHARVYAQYSSFYIDSENDGYKLHISGYVDGGAGDSLSYYNGNQFVTFDRDISSWALTYEGGFWLGSYPFANPNGVYKWGSRVPVYSGVQWHDWKGDYYSLKSIEMKIRRVFLTELEEQFHI